jgi:hypothetical protein
MYDEDKTFNEGLLRMMDALILYTQKQQKPMAWKTAEELFDPSLRKAWNVRKP